MGLVAVLAEPAVTGGLVEGGLELLRAIVLLAGRDGGEASGRGTRCLWDRG